jgi:predicted RNA-binding Zn ribbon-like protein
MSRGPTRNPTRAATQFFGGRVCLDFANTVDWRTSAEPEELLGDYAAYLSWSKARRTLPAKAISRLQVLSGEKPASAERVMQRAHALRADIWRAAEALIAGHDVDLEPFNRLLATMPAQPDLVRDGAGYVHDLAGKSLDEPLWPIGWSLSALISSDDARRVGCCEAHGCGWFYIDESPNRSRLWCSSEVCGNRERARRAYARRRNDATGKQR